MSSPPLPDSPSLNPLFTYCPFDHSSRIFKRSGEFPSPTESERKAEEERLEREAEIFGSPTLRREFDIMHLSLCYSESAKK